MTIFKPVFELYQVLSISNCNFEVYQESILYAKVLPIFNKCNIDRFHGPFLFIFSQGVYVKMYFFSEQ